MQYLNLQSWEAAESRYPNHTRKERLEPFLEFATFKKDSLPPSFIAYCQQAKQQELAQQSKPQDMDNTVKVGDVTATVLTYNALCVETSDILSSVQQPGLGFTGINLTLLDPPEVSVHMYRCMRVSVLCIYACTV